MPDKILLAEDSLTIQKVFELTFARSDVSLTMVDNGDDAVRMTQELRPDLVIADLSLPGKTGFEVASALRSSEGTKRIPVLLLSGTLVPFDEEAYKRSGAKGVVFKPFETQALLDKVHDLMAAPAPSEGGKEEPLPGDEPWDFSDVLESVEEDSAAAAVPPGRTAAEEPPPPRKEEFLAGGGSFEGFTSGGKVSLGEYDVRVEDLETAEPPAAPAPPPAPPAAAAEGGEDELSLLDRLAAGDEIDFAAPPPAAAPAAPTAPVAAPPVPSAPVAAAPAPPREESLPAEAPPGPLAGVSPGEEEPFLEESFFGFEAESGGTPPEEGGELSLAGLIAEEATAPAEAPPAPAPPAPSVARAAAPASASATAAELLQREEFSARVREAVERAAGEAMEKVLWEWMDRLSADFREQIRLSVESVAWDVIPKVAEAVIRDEIARLSDPNDETSPE